MKTISIPLAALALAAAAASSMDDVRIYGPVADRMNACITFSARRM